MNANIAALLYLVSGALFILALRGLASPETARIGNRRGMIGMGLAILTTLAVTGVSDALTWVFVLGGLGIGGAVGAATARRIAMTAMPQLVAAFHSLVGLAAVLVAGAALYSPDAYGICVHDAANMCTGLIKTQSLIEMSLGVAIGAITFAGSIIAFAKLNGNMSGAPILLPARHLLNLLIALLIVGLVVYFVIVQAPWTFWAITVLSFIFGITLIIPIGGADMPVVVSMLNSYSGWAAAGIGFTLENTALIITGALVGSSGAILSYIMCKGMNRSFISVIAGGFGGETAVAQAQHAVREMAEKLKHEGVKVSYAIHPVAGRMPGHMNVLLAEANVPYDEVFELEDINSQFAQADVAYVIGANDVTNPAAKTNPQSPIFGMPILDVEKAKTVLFIKRGMGSGYAGIENELFFRDNTMMLFSDAKKMTEEIVKALG
jgi:NAD(P) transhydrogenase subunit beta